MNFLLWGVAGTFYPQLLLPGESQLEPVLAGWLHVMALGFRERGQQKRIGQSATRQRVFS